MGTKNLKKFPKFLVTEDNPNKAISQCFGPAVSFWEGVSLTCWFCCEGPYSRVWVNDLINYHSKDLDALEALGCPIDMKIFDDINEASKKMSPRTKVGEPLLNPDGSHSGVTFYAGPEQYDGFEYFRDSITKASAEWSEKFLDKYLKERWTQDLLEVGQSYNRFLVSKNKEPNARQFSEIAVSAANNWFSGRLDQVCDVLQIKAPVDNMTFNKRAPEDMEAFKLKLIRNMGVYKKLDEVEENKERSKMITACRLADHSIKVLNMLEITNEYPPYKGNSWAKKNLESWNGPNLEEGWDRYINSIKIALNELYI